ncbi:hypothetical protein SmJEL517_g04217 [Synchytrium microbalum]|uniref:Piwi domain-containing protein n=1 Tax=Synchytrium microbalum TaxID=1806994 RepID=A0A507C025_9FUNG|nr:uncharacterized protein SmJEL517_g04217 [Synchytrium microbalum]TPX32741.1 hypothetical protein SmJEL517_g04217 [Synchytrium microbalum]
MLGGQLPSVAAPVPQPITKPTKGGQQVLRPGYGTKGRMIRLHSNFFPIEYRGIKIAQYDVDIFPTSNVTVKRHIIEAWKRNYAASFPGNNNLQHVIKRIIFDGSKIMFALEALPFNTQQEFEVQVPWHEDTRFPWPQDTRLKTWSVKVQPTTIVDLSLLNSYLTYSDVGGQPDLPRAAFQVLEVLIKHQPAQLFNTVGRNGLMVHLGWFQSVRAGYQSLLLNLDVSATAFYEVDTVYNVASHFFHHQSLMAIWHQLSQRQTKSLTSFLKGVKAQTTYRGGINDVRYRIVGVDSISAAQRKVPQNGNDEDSSPESIVQYYYRMYGIRLQFPDLPCVIAGGKTPKYLPMELLKVKSGQRHTGLLKPEQLAEMIKETAKSPMDRFQRIIKGETTIHNKEFNDFMLDWGLQVEKRLLQVQGRILPPPSLTTAGGRVVQPRNGAWQSQGFFHPSTVQLKYWSIVTVDTQLRDFERRAVENFRGVLSQMLNNKGLTVLNQQPGIIDGTRFGGDIQKMLLEAGKVAINNAPKQRPQLIICILARKNNPLYPDIKRVAETTLGVMTQCVALPNLTKDRGLDMYVDNVTLKINAKLGGINTALDPARAELPDFVMRKPTMFMGADVTHPKPGSTVPSIAAVVGSMDNRFCVYNSAISSQTTRVEVIGAMKKGVRELFENFKVRNGVYPQKIVFFRDGVSEGQYLEIMMSEVRDIKQVFQDIRVEGTLTFIVVTKRHHARFVPVEERDASPRNGNCPPGTTVDSSVVHPFAHDYYQFGSDGIKGTSRPAHYRVLFDEHDLDADSLQGLTFRLSHLYARCNRSVSLVAPVMYAHLAAARARMLLPDYDGGSSEGSAGAPQAPMKEILPGVRKTMWTPSMTKEKCVLQAHAYAKIVLHAAKYPIFAVNGIVIGTVDKDASTLHIEDAIPLFHGTGVYLEPMTLAALQHIQEYCNQTSRQIVGCYVANESHSDTSIPEPIHKLATKIQENLKGHGVLMVVDNSKLGETEVAIEPYTFHAGSWTALDTTLWKTEYPESLPKLIQSSAYDKLYDFDNHLDNVTLDWLQNQELDKVLKK